MLKTKVKSFVNYFIFYFRKDTAKLMTIESYNS
jgi:hypothetical protein